MDFLYVVGGSSSWGDKEELRYSMRSVIEYYPEAVFTIVGYKPGWVGNIRHIRCGDLSADHMRNIMLKLRTGFVHPLCPEAMFVMSDDYYLLSRLDGSWIWNRPLKDDIAELAKDRRPGDWWLMAQESALRLCRSLGVEDPGNYATHTPFLVNRKEAIRTCDVMMGLTGGCEFSTLHACLHEGKRIKGANAKGRWPSIRNLSSVSSGPKQESKRDFRAWLKAAYPTPAKHELW